MLTAEKKRKPSVEKAMTERMKLRLRLKRAWWAIPSSRPSHSYIPKPMRLAIPAIMGLLERQRLERGKARR